MIYVILHFFCFVLFKLLFRLDAVGLENIPKNGPCLFCSNHASNLDPFLVGTVITDRKLWFMVKSEAYIDSKLILWIYKQLNMFSVKRGGVNIRALHKALKLVKNGKALMLFPEGSRTKDGKISAFKAGSGMIADLSAAKVVPVYIKGSYEALPRGSLFPRFTKIRVCFGKPMDFTHKKPVENRKRYQQEVTERIREEILALSNS